MPVIDAEWTHQRRYLQRRGTLEAALSSNAREGVDSRTPPLEQRRLGRTGALTGGCRPRNAAQLPRGQRQGVVSHVWRRQEGGASIHAFSSKQALSKRERGVAQNAPSPPAQEHPIARCLHQPQGAQVDLSLLLAGKGIGRRRRSEQLFLDINKEGRELGQSWSRRP